MASRGPSPGSLTVDATGNSLTRQADTCHTVPRGQVRARGPCAPEADDPELAVRPESTGQAEWSVIQTPSSNYCVHAESHTEATLMDEFSIGNVLCLSHTL